MSVTCAGVQTTAVGIVGPGTSVLLNFKCGRRDGRWTESDPKIPATARMTDTGLTVPGMTETPCCYDVTVTVKGDGDHLPHPAEFFAAAEQAASARAVHVMSAHTAEKIVSIVTV